MFCRARDPQRVSTFWANRIPILVGLSGKRFFDRISHEKDKETSERIRDSLLQCFTALDSSYPYSPKILLTGGAIGADLLAVQAALDAGERWRVALILPFEAELMRQDFSPPAPEWTNACAQAQRDFDWLVQENHNELITVKILPKLLKHPPTQENSAAPRVEGAIDRGKPEFYSEDELSRESPVFDRRARHMHYEQVGQWIAEAATIFIAVTEEALVAKAEELIYSDESANGASSRITAIRRHGRPLNKAGVEVARRSLVLGSDWSEGSDWSKGSEWSDVLPPPERYAWLIESSLESCCLESNAYGVKVLEPPSRASLEATLPRSILCRDRAEAPDEILSKSLLAIKQFNDFNMGASAEDDAWRTWSTKGNSTRDEPNYPIDVLGTIRKKLSNRLGRAKNWSHAAFWGIAAIFVIVVLSFEVFAKFSPKCPKGILSGHLVFLFVIWALVVAARMLRWQPKHEDYRAVSEMLRVQRAWWAAGLSKRVDRERFLGVDADLAPLREAVTALLSWILLQSCWLDDRPMQQNGGGSRRWDVVRAGGREPRCAIAREKNSPPDWIGSQIHYFSRHQPVRECWAKIAETMSWFLFLTAGALTLAIPLFLYYEPVAKVFQTALLWPESRKVAAALVFLLFAIFRMALVNYGKATTRIAITTVFAILAALALTIFASFLGERVDPFFHGCHFGESETFHLAPSEQIISTTEYAMIVIVVLLNALAGAWRFLSERLGWEAEAHNFRDMRELFVRAEMEFASKWDMDGGPADGEKEQIRKLVLELGRLALNDAEAWLKMRRERPLQPV